MAKCNVFALQECSNTDCKQVRENAKFRVQAFFYLCRHPPGTSWAGITNRVDHVSNGRTPGSMALHELPRDFHPVLSLFCVANDLGPGEGFEICVGIQVRRRRRCRSTVGLWCTGFHFKYSLFYTIYWHEIFYKSRVKIKQMNHVPLKHEIYK